MFTVRQRLRSWAAILSLSLAFTACGGDTTQPVPPPGPPPPPPPPPAAVATVLVAPEAVTLSPQATQQLTATPRDAQGTPLTGRTIVWASNAPAVASVSTAGLVTALTPGTATISATSEGKSGTAEITVATGAVVGPQGGTFTFDDGALTVTVPAGAVGTPIVLSVTTVAAPSAPPPEGWQIAGPVYQLRPAGAVFSQPVTVTIRYDAGDLPPFVMSGDLAMLQRGSGAWQGLSDFAVDVAGGAASGRTGGFGAAPGAHLASSEIYPNDGPPTEVVLAVEDPEVSLSPSSASVNDAHRHAGLYVVVTPRGEGIPLPPTAEPILYRWRTSGQHGAIIGPGPTEWTATMEVEYLATNPVLSEISGEIDRVWVDVLLNPESLTDPAAGPQRIVTAEAVIDADLQVTYDLTPTSVTVDAGDDTDLKLLLRNKQGQELPLPSNQFVEWGGTNNHGSIPAEVDRRQTTVTYTADTEFEFTPPRVDEVTVIVRQENRHVVRVAKPTPIGGFINDYEDEHITTPEQGRAKAFVTVKVDYQVTLAPDDDKVAVGASTGLEVSLDPDDTGPGIWYRYTTAGTHGSLSVASGELTEQDRVTYEAREFAAGGPETIQVEVVSVVAGVVLETLGTAEAIIEVDPWRAGRFQVVTAPTGVGTGTSVIPYIFIPKVSGATQYEVLADGFNHPTWGTEFQTTFSGPGGSGVGSVEELGSEYRIRMEGGGACSTLGSCVTAMVNAQNARFAGIKVRFKATN